MTNQLGMNKPLVESSTSVASVLDATLNGTGVMHICVLLADSTTDPDGTEMAFVSNVPIHEVPRAVRLFADQLEAKLAEEQ